MFLKTLIVGFALVGSAFAQRPANVSVCDYYTTVLLKNNTAENQLTHMTLLVNTVVIGNYTKPTIEGITWPDVMVPGILANGTMDGKNVSLLPFFNGELASTNRGGMAGMKVDFLDDGGAAPLLLNKPANGTKSRQYKLLTHLYSFFGALLGCSQLSSEPNAPFPAYAGNPSQHAVHKYMDLSAAEFAYSVAQVGLAARSFGVAEQDVAGVAKALNDTFGVKCSANVTVVEGQPAAEQAVCLGDGCPVADGGRNCPKGEGNVTKPTSSSSSKAGAAATGAGMAGSALAAGLGALAYFL